MALLLMPICVRILNPLKAQVLARGFDAALRGILSLVRMYTVVFRYWNVTSKFLTLLD